MDLNQRIDEWFDLNKENMMSDIMRLVRIPSVSVPDSDGQPFGRGCADALNEMLKIAREHGFNTHNYENYVGRISSGEPDMADTIGFWNHLDVVPAGSLSDWEYAPFEPEIKNGFLIGRGAQDNKGPAIGMLYVMKCLRELGVPLKHSICLYVGCDEERKMEDLKYYTEKYEVPALSMIADSGFPVCYGEKGILEGQILSGQLEDERILGFTGGSASNMIPDYAELVMQNSDELRKEVKAFCSGRESTDWKESEGILTVYARGTSRHSAFPDGSVNAIYVLADALKNAGFLKESDRRKMKFLADGVSDYYGKCVGIEFEDDISGKTTCAGTVLSIENRRICLNYNIRYSITADSDSMIKQLEVFAGNGGWSFRLENDSKPNYFPKEHPAVKLLTDFYNREMNLSTEAFVMGGGTYARKLPNAFAYGIGGMPESDADKACKEITFKPGHGGAHQPDEGLNLRLYFTAMKLYTKAIIEMNKI